MFAGVTARAQVTTIGDNRLIELLLIFIRIIAELSSAESKYRPWAHPRKPVKPIRQRLLSKGGHLSEGFVLILIKKRTVAVKDR